MMQIQEYWSKIVNWLENGDLVPWLIIVSVPHYVNVLASFEHAVVAAVLGFLVDLGHYRTIKSYLLGKGWLWMVVLTFVSFGFHVGFYAVNDAGFWAWILGPVVPIIIFALANLAHKERWGAKAQRAARSGNLPATRTGIITAQTGKTDWRHLTGSEKNAIKGMSTDEILQKYPIKSRTARKWKERLN